MNLFLSNLSGKALYEQIYEQIKNLILEGSLKEGDALPTIRGLAKDLRISVITTSRAYADLERDGYICSVVGKGTFVAERGKEFAREKNLAETDELLCRAAEMARRGGLSEEEFVNAAKAAFRR